MWFKQFYGDPDAASITATGPEDDSVDYFEDDGSDPLPAEFDNPEQVKTFPRLVDYHSGFKS
jgi:hypothetical protein